MRGTYRVRKSSTPLIKPMATTALRTTCCGTRWAVREPRYPPLTAPTAMESYRPIHKAGKCEHRGSHSVHAEATPVLESIHPVDVRSEERRVGKECRCRW